MLNEDLIKDLLEKTKNSTLSNNLKYHIKKFEEEDNNYIFVYFGIYFKGLKKYTTALNYFNLVLVDYPNDIRTLLNKVSTLNYLNKLNEASKTMENVNSLIKSNNEKIKIYLKFAEESYLFGDYKLSIELCDIILDLSPKNKYALTYKKQALNKYDFSNKRCCFNNCWTYFLDKNIK